MKRPLYSIDDEEFMTLLERTGEVLRARSIPYIFVGGVATQAHIVNYLCQKREGTTIYGLSHDHDFRIQDHLRATDDADITLDTRRISDNSQDVKVHQELIESLRDIEGEGDYISPTGDHLVSIKLERSGAKRPVFRLGLDRDADSPDSEVSLNFYYGPEDTNNRWPKEMADFERANYYDFFNTVQNLSIPFSPGKNVNLLVKGVEQLLATKIARAREKDWTDILLLYRHSNESGKPINMSEIERLLSAEDSRYHTSNLVLLDRFDRFRNLVK